MIEPADQPIVLAELARGNRPPDTMDVEGVRLLDKLFHAPGDRQNSERGLAILALEDGRVAVSSIIEGKHHTADDVAYSLVDWSVLLGPSNEFKSPEQGGKVVGALLLHLHPRTDRTPGTPSTAIWMDEGKALSGDLAFLLSANRPGSNTRGELPLDIPLAVGTLPASGKAFNIMQRDPLTESESDAAFIELRRGILNEFASRAADPRRAIEQGYNLDVAYPTIWDVGRLLNELSESTGVKMSLVQSRRKEGAPVRVRTYAR